MGTKFSPLAWTSIIFSVAFGIALLKILLRKFQKQMAGWSMFLSSSKTLEKRLDIGSEMEAEMKSFDAKIIDVGLDASDRMPKLDDNLLKGNSPSLTDSSSWYSNESQFSDDQRNASGGVLMADSTTMAGPPTAGTPPFSGTSMAGGVNTQEEGEEMAISLDDGISEHSVELSDDWIPKLSKWRVCRRFSQKLQQIFLTYNSAYAIFMILVTCLKLYIQIFDVVTDILVAQSLQEEVDGIYFGISIALIVAPCVAKWVTTGEFITQKCNQGQLPRFVTWLHFFFPTGVFLPFILDIHIVSVTINGQLSSLFTGIPYKLDDSLFSIHRTFALSEVQLESLPQAIFQTVILCIDWQNKQDDAFLIFTSIGISLGSIIFQYLQLKRLSEKEEFHTVFELVQTLSRGEFIPGVNRIKSSDGSILNLYDVFLDRNKINFVRDLLRQRPNLTTVVLNPSVLTFDFDFLKDWLLELNSISLKFLRAERVQDIQSSFDKIDIDGNGEIDIHEFSVCGRFPALVWADKYGSDFSMNPKGVLNFIRTENVELPGTCFTLYEIPHTNGFDAKIQERSMLFIRSFCKELKLKDVPAQAIGLATDEPFNKMIKHTFTDDFYTIEINYWSGRITSRSKYGYCGRLEEGMIVESVSGVKIGGNARDIKKIMDHSPQYEVIAIQEKDEPFTVENTSGDIRFVNGSPLSYMKTKRIDFAFVRFLYLPMIVEINLSDSDVKQVHKIFQGYLPSLRFLNFTNCRALSDYDCHNMSGVPNLQTLIMDKSNWSNLKLIFESGHTNLKYLSFKECDKLGGHDKICAIPPNLECVHFEKSEFWCDSFILEINHENLKELGLGVGLENISTYPEIKSIGPPHLEKLSVRGHWTFSSFGKSTNFGNVKAILESDHGSLEELTFKNSPKLNFSDVEYIGLPNLRILAFDDSTVDAKVILESDHPQIEELSFSSSSVKNSDSVRYLGLPNLKKVNFRCTKTFDAFKVVLESNHENLRDIDWSFHKKDLSSKLKEVEFLGLPNLNRLNLSSFECPINLKMILESGHPNLEEINISECKNLECTTIEAIRLPNLKIFTTTDSNWANKKISRKYKSALWENKRIGFKTTAGYV